MDTHTIMQTYPTRTDYFKDESGNVSVLRICCQQSNQAAFESVRGTELSIGSSSVANVVGLGRGLPKDFLKYRLQCFRDPNYALEEKSDLVTHKRDPLIKGTILEPLSACVYEQLTNMQTYDGEFIKLKRSYPPSENQALLESYEYGLYNNSSDAVVLLDEVIQVASSDEIDLAKTNALFRLTFSQSMHPLALVSHGLEIKNTFREPCTSLPTLGNYASAGVMKLEHVAQCQFQCWALNVEFVDYISTFFDWNPDDYSNPIGSVAHLKHVFLVRVYRSNEFIKEMLDRISKFHCAMLNDQPYLPYEMYNVKDFLNQCRLEIIFNIPEQEFASFDLSSVYHVSPSFKSLW